MPLDFPSSPAVGTYYNGYIWDGTVWDSALQPSVPALLTTAPVYANEAARTSAVPSPAEGQLSYLNDINQFQGYAGTSWRPIGGLAPVIPSTVAVSGGTATANSLGVISFTNATSISLNNVFSDTYRNYRVIIDFTGSSANTSVAFRFRKNGADYSGAQYNFGGAAHRDSGTSTAFVGANATSWSVCWINGPAAGAGSAGGTLDLFNPWVNSYQKSVATFRGGDNTSGAGIFLGGNCFSNQQNDGMTLFPVSGNFTGTVQVLGYNS